MHPVLYVSLVNTITEEKNWKDIREVFISSEKNDIVTCCSLPNESDNLQSDKASQITQWVNEFEQKSIELSLEFTHILCTDITNCYGSLYTHSISWALHGQEIAKQNKNEKNLLGNKIDRLIRYGRCGQTNGISQGSNLMDFIAEIILSHIDHLIYNDIKGNINNVKILRYRDDYRIFSNNDADAEAALKIISDCLLTFGMQLGAKKTSLSKDIIRHSLKEDKIEAITLQGIGKPYISNIQKQLLLLHKFGQKYPNSGALKRLLSNLHKELSDNYDTNPSHPYPNLQANTAIATDIAFTSPATFPIIAGILSLLLISADKDTRDTIWNKICSKIKLIPNNNWVEIWLQRITKPNEIKYVSHEKICRIVNGEHTTLWENGWISDEAILAILEQKNILLQEPEKEEKIIRHNEIKLFRSPYI